MIEPTVDERLEQYAQHCADRLQSLDMIDGISWSHDDREAYITRLRKTIHFAAMRMRFAVDDFNKALVTVFKPILEWLSGGKGTDQ